MVQIDKNTGKIVINTNATIEDISRMQNALIELIQFYNYKDFSNAIDDTFYYSLELLKTIMPNYEQQKTGIESDLEKE